MIRRPPRSTLDRSSAASDVYKRQVSGLSAPRDYRLDYLDANGCPAFYIAKVSLIDCGNTALGAVSYTHLRAHETVLDLVCRLLLEKKNINLHDHTHVL